MLTELRNFWVQAVLDAHQTTAHQATKALGPLEAQTRLGLEMARWNLELWRDLAEGTAKLANPPATKA